MVVEKRKLLLLLFDIAFFLLGICNITFLILGIQLLLLLTLKDKRKPRTIISLILAITLVSLVKISIIEFNFIPQAKVLLDINPNLLQWLKIGHIHAIRLFLAYPGYILSKIYQIPLNLGYSFYLCVIFFLTYIFICNICSIEHIRNFFPMIIIFISIIVLALIMNGRIIFAFTGFSMLINTALEQSHHKTYINLKEIILFVVGILFTTVSSGCMVIGILYFFMCMFIKWTFIPTRKKKIKIIIISVCIIFVLAPIVNKMARYVIFMINKNVLFFGGGLTSIYGMLEHGLGGKILPKINATLYFPLLELGSILLLCNIIIIKKIIIKSYDINTIIIIAINISFYGILVGFSTGSMIIIPLIILICMRLNQFKILGK